MEKLLALYVFPCVAGLVMAVLLLTDFKKLRTSVKDYMINFLKDAEMLYCLHGKPGVIKTRHLIINFAFSVGTLILNSYFYIIEKKLSFVLVFFFIISSSTLFYLQARRNRANKWKNN